MSEKRIVRVRFGLSDLHLSEGVVLADGRPNPREDFKDIDGYERLLGAFPLRYPEDVSLDFFWRGDIVDFNPIRWRGSFRIVPTEEAALGEFETCLNGHRRFWDATSRFLQASPLRTLTIQIGNHDLPFVWPMVQERLKARLLPAGEWHRISFVYGEEIEGEVLNIHGDALDPLNANPPEKDLFITAKADRGPMATSVLAMLVGGFVAWGVYTGAKDLTVWRALVVLAGVISSFILLGAIFRKFVFWRSGPDTRFLNMPYGAHLDSWLVAILKARFPWFGRMTDPKHYVHQPINMLRHWRYVVLMGPLTIFHLLYHRFFRDLVAARRKARIWSTIRLFSAMTKPPNLLRLLWKILDRHPQVKVVIIGHFHIPAIHTLRRGGREVVFIDGGTGIEQVSLDPTKDRFTEFTPTETLTFADNSQRVRLLRFNSQAPKDTDPFTPYLES